MDSLNAEDLKIEVSQADGVIRLDWLGKSSARQPAQVLAPFFDELVREAKGAEAVIEMHFERLEYFNSSTISTLIQLIQDLRGHKIAMVVTFDGGLRWQKMSFDALRIFERSDGLLSFRTASEA